MLKCKVLVDRVSLVVSKDSVVFIDEKQYELAKNYVSPLVENKEVVAVKSDSSFVKTVSNDKPVEDADEDKSSSKTKGTGKKGKK